MKLNLLIFLLHLVHHVSAIWSLKQYLNEFTRATHKYEIVGWLTTRVRLDAGLDADHEDHSDAQARKHAFET